MSDDLVFWLIFGTGAFITYVCSVIFWCKTMASVNYRGQLKNTDITAGMLWALLPALVWFIVLPGGVVWGAIMLVLNKVRGSDRDEGR